MAGKKIQIILIILLLNITCFLGVMITSAYLMAKDNAENHFSIGNCKNSIVEEYEEITNLEPGMVVNKIVSVKNTGNNACYIRVLALFSDSDAQGYAQLDINDTDWRLSEDGYYYYNGVLPSGQTTTNLFSTVSISEDVDEEMLKGFNIFIYAESINVESGGFS